MDAPVQEIMTKNVHFIEADDSLRTAVKLIKRHKIRHLPVVKNKTVVGMISTTDLDRLTFSTLFANERDVDEAILEMFTITQVMAAKPVVVQADATIRKVAEIFSNQHFHSLPVVENGELVGIVTTTDIIKYMLADIG